MLGLEFLKRIVNRKNAVVTEPKKISGYATQLPNWSVPGQLTPAYVPNSGSIVYAEKKSVKQAIVDFITEKGVGSQFSANQLRAYVNRFANPAPGSTDRILRDLRNRAVIGYVVVDRQLSTYEITTPRVSVPDATGDTTPYFNSQANDIELISLDEALKSEESADDFEYAQHSWADDGGPFYDNITEGD